MMWVRLGWRFKGSEDGKDRLRLSSWPWALSLLHVAIGQGPSGGGPSSVPLRKAGGSRR